MEETKIPGFFKMIRAPFLSSILAPILAGILLGLTINEELNVAGAVLVLIIGLGLLIAANVYNDIYDTIQGTDRVNVHRNKTSGGSGVLMDFPELMPKMYNIARVGLLMALVGTAALTLFIELRFWPLLWTLYLISAFFSKYYAAPPPKLAYRGWGEISVWFAFGPIAVLLAAVSQNIAFHPQVLLLMPATGLSTLSILLARQMIDIDADRKAGKHGVAVRLGTKATAIIYLVVQLLIVMNVLVWFFSYTGETWPFLLCLIPYLLIFPQSGGIMLKYHDDPDKVKKGAKLTVLIHLLFSFLLIAGFVIYYFAG
ncbi:MAG: prenyltransferase [Prolixibacteraceae bacterium]